MPAVRVDVEEWVRRWWRGEAGAPGAILDVATYPAELLFRAVSWSRNRLYDAEVLRQVDPSVPVVSIGNLTVGGTGKTPVSAWVVGRLRSWGRHPAVLMRGYGADEIVLHREINPGTPVVAARRRSEGVPEAVRQGADCIVLDDGFQHRGIRRQVDIVLVAAEQWHPRRRRLPRGPWRESVSSLRRADFVLVTRKSAGADEAAGVLRDARRFGAGGPGGVVELRLGGMTQLAQHTGTPGGAPQPGEEVVVVTSLAEPYAFEAQLRGTGLRVAPIRFPDHHSFSEADVKMILDIAGDRALVMTRKEAVKLRALLPRDARAFVANQEVVFESGQTELEEALRTGMQAPRTGTNG